MPAFLRRVLTVGLMTSLLVALPIASEGGTFRFKASCSSGCSWAPTFKRVAKGTKIVWKNPTGVFHDVKSYKGKWLSRRDLPPGSKTHKVMRRRGRFFFRCTIHSTLNDGVCSGMCGKIRVRRA
jgi:plastocyanin